MCNLNRNFSKVFCIFTLKFFFSRLGLSESLFKRLDRPEVVSVLSLQYRMNSEIMKLANNFTYDNMLQCEDKNICSATIDVENFVGFLF